MEVAGKRPTVSVVITNYNYGRYISGAIESARTADEIIVVDDGSTDGSIDVINGLTGITPILKPNGGHVSAVNAGFAASHGDVVIFLDADDRLGADCIAAVKAKWTPKVSKVQWGLRGVDADGTPTGSLFPEFTDRHTPQWCQEQMRRQHWYVASATSGNAWSRAFLDWVMPLPQYAKYVVVDDYMSVLAPYVGDVVSLAYVFGEYRFHAGQMSSISQFTEDRLERDTNDDEVRYNAVNDFLVQHGHTRLDVLRWSQHTIKRIFLIRLGRSREKIWPLLPRHITATLSQDTGLDSKVKNIILGLVLMIPYRPLASWLARVKYT
jgi:glycosyltransferase involved in cell wall biosynthesis